VAAKVSPAATDFLLAREGLSSLSLFQDYARYLLDTSGICQLPVSLDLIRQKLNISRKSSPFADGRGFLHGSTIYINYDDPSTVQRFTEAHELMESLVVALRFEQPPRFPANSRHQFEKDKENWCEQGAAELLMPAANFFPLVARQGTSLATGRSLAGLCQTSLTATLRRMLDSDLSPCIFAILREGYKKHQIVPSKTGQRVLWGVTADWDPPAELRVWKHWRSPQVMKYLCKNESFPRTSLTYQVIQSGIVGQVQQVDEILDLEHIQGLYQIEAMLVTIEKIPSVMTLIHL
jgi:Zn-dependent peptidase ImmA (M78 family)